MPAGALQVPVLRDWRKGIDREAGKKVLTIYY